MRLNVIVQKGLEQVRPVDLHGDFLKEVIDIEVLSPNFVLNELVGDVGCVV